MNTTQTLTQMQDLKLTGMAASYRCQLELPVNQQLEGVIGNYNYTVFGN